MPRDSMHSDVYWTHIYSNKTVQGVLILNHKWMFQSSWSHNTAAAAAAAKSLQLCPSLCDPIDGSPPGFPHPWDSPGKNTGVGCLQYETVFKSRFITLYRRQWSKPSPGKKKCRMVVWGGPTNSWEKKRRERQRRKGTIYTSECRFPKNSRRDKKAEEIEENNRMGKTRALFK